MVFLRCNYSYEKSFSEDQFWCFLFGDHLLWSNRASAHAEAEKNRFFMLVWLYLVCLSSTHLGCSPAQSLLGCSLLWGAISMPVPFCVRPSNDILQFHCPQPTQLIFLRNDACMAFVLILSSCLAKSFKIPSDSMIYWIGEQKTISLYFHPFQDIFASRRPRHKCFALEVWPPTWLQVGVGQNFHLYRSQLNEEC